MSEFFFISASGVDPKNSPESDNESPNEESPNEESPNEESPNEEYSPMFGPAHGGPSIDGIESRENFLNFLNTVLAAAARTKAEEHKANTLSMYEAERLEEDNYERLISLVVAEKAQNMEDSVKASLEHRQNNSFKLRPVAGRVHPSYADLLPYQIAFAKAEAYMSLAELGLELESRNILSHETNKDCAENKIKLMRESRNTLRAICQLIRDQAI